MALVCKAWSYLVKTTPRLWSSFEIVLDDWDFTRARQDDITKRLQLWLRRSRQCPLSFRITHKDTGRATDLLGSASTDFLETLVSHASRWQHVQFHGPSGSFVLLQDQLSNGNIPTLRSLSFHINESFGSSLDIASLNIPWSQLSGLDLQLYQSNVHSLNEYFEFLSSAPNLTWCTFNATFPFTLSDHPEKIILPHLRSLKMSIQGNDSGGIAERSFLDFLGQISVTQLMTFSLEWLVDRVGDGGESRWTHVHPRFMDFIHSSVNTLESLELAYLPLHDHEIIGCLDGMSNMRGLDLKFSLSGQKLDPITADFLDYLQGGRPDVFDEMKIDHLHLLRTLKLQCSGRYLDQAKLQSLVDRRAGAGLGNFELMTMNSMSKAFMDRMVLWRSRGLSFSTSTLNLW